MASPSPNAEETVRAGVPVDATRREALRAAAQAYVRERRLVPPLSLEELREHAVVLAETERARDVLDFVTVLVSNAAWRETVAGLPYDRRLLLLPQCLRSSTHCQAEHDNFGLLCDECGSCSLGTAQREAEELGYVVLIAEGTTVVTRLLEQGKVDAVIGVSCLDGLEKSFPHMSNEAIPGLAIPLLRDGCRDTEVDLGWLMEAIHLRADTGWTDRVDVDAVRREVDSWFTQEILRELIAGDGTESEELAIEWLAQSGKRWRPFLTVAACQSIQGRELGEMPDTLRRVAVAVECFHKASLIHDDIEDDDDIRYGTPTLHRRVSMPVALNVGDLLLGEGYRLLAEVDLPVQIRAEMLRVAALGHRQLSLGQGDELCWSRDPRPVTLPQVLSIFERKTAPAFEVALRLGVLHAGADRDTHRVLAKFSRDLGIAYQIRDDLADFHEEEASDILSGRPSILHGLAAEHGSATLRQLLDEALRNPTAERTASLLKTIASEGMVAHAETLLDHFRNEAVRSLVPLRNSQLKGLLRRLVSRIVERKRPRHASADSVP
jgi:geranylgeranyl pyrophosphate synthase